MLFDDVRVEMKVKERRTRLYHCHGGRGKSSLLSEPNMAVTTLLTGI